MLLSLKKWVKPKYLAVAVAVFYLAFVGYGSVNTWAAVPYIVLSATCVLVVLVAFNKLGERYYPIALFALALALLWQNSMYGTYIVGNDIHRELFLTKVAIEGGWNPSTYTVYMTNASFVVGLLVPFLANVFAVDPVWVYKAILPVLLAGVPVLLYYAFAREFGKRVAFYGAVFLLAVPVMSMELIGIAKTMVAELFLALMVWAISSGIRQWRKFGLIAVSLALCILAHYTVGGVAVAYLVAIGAIRGGLGWTKWFRVKRTAVLTLFLAVVVTLGAGYLFYAKVSNGAVVLAVGKLINYLPGINMELEAVEIESDYYTVSLVPDRVGGTHVDEDVVFDGGPKSVEDELPPSSTDNTEDTADKAVEQLLPKGGGVKLWEGMPPLLKTALGNDFTEASPWGQAFRIVQFLSQVAIILGAVYIFLRYKKYNISAEFRAGIVAALCLLLICVVFPRLGGMINITRIYHMSLFFLAPLFVVGIALVAKRYWAYAVAGVLAVYLMFTMGLVYEATNSEAYKRFDTPYSVAFSGDRVGLIPIYTEADLRAAEWVKGNTGLEPVAGDMGAVLLMSGYVEAIPKLKSAVLQPPYSYYNLPEGGYILLTEWNVQTGSMSHPLSEGLRLIEPLVAVGGTAVYDNGARVIER